MFSTADISGVNGKINSANNISVANSQHGRPVNWLESDGLAWEADLWGGLYKNTNGNLEQIVPDGPSSSSVYGLDAHDGTLRVAPGGVDDSWGFTWNGDGFFVYENNKWKTTNLYTFPSMNTSRIIFYFNNPR